MTVSIQPLQHSVTMKLLLDSLFAFMVKSSTLESVMYTQFVIGRSCCTSLWMKMSDLLPGAGRITVRSGRDEIGDWKARCTGLSYFASVRICCALFLWPLIFFNILTKLVLAVIF